jgi:hypothetical protein
VCQGSADIDYASAGTHHIDDGHRQLFGMALGMMPSTPLVSEKMDRTKSAHAGQMAGATETRLATNAAATKVPCLQASLSARETATHARRDLSNDLAHQLGKVIATGGSIKPIETRGLPHVRCISKFRRANLRPPEASALPDNMSLERFSTVAKDNSN